MGLSHGSVVRIQSIRFQVASFEVWSPSLCFDLLFCLIYLHGLMGNINSCGRLWMPLDALGEPESVLKNGCC